MNENKSFFLISMEDLRHILQECIAQCKGNSPLPSNYEDKWISTNEVVKMLNVSRPTLWRWAKEEYLVPQKRGQKLNVYRLSDVERVKAML